MLCRYRHNVHWTAPAHRANRDLSRYAKDRSERAREELVAELGACFLSADLGIVPELEPRADHARYLASKVATDLKKFQRFYGAPSDEWIEKYEKELAVLLKYNAVSTVVYGFKRNGKWTEASVQYKVMPDGTLTTNDDPGKIRPNLDVAGASFTSFLTEKSVTADSTSAIAQEVPFQRTTGEAPPLETGHWENDLSYSAAGRGLGRATVRR